MRRVIPALALLALTAAVFLLSREDPPVPPPAPVAGPPAPDACPPPPEARIPPPSPDGAPADEAEYEHERTVTEARTVRVLTNVPGAEVTLTVELFGGEPDPEPIARIADADGNAAFTLPALREPIAHVFARATARGHVPVRKALNLSAGKVELRLLRGSPVRGRVLAKGGGPLAGASVTLGTKAVTDETGAFEVFFQREGEAHVVVSHPEYLGLSTTVVLPADDLEFVLERGLTVSGRVTFPDGSPAHGVLVASDYGKRVFSGRDGSYVLSGFPQTTVRVRCLPGGETRTAQAGHTDVDFVLARHVLRFHVKDEQGRTFRRARLLFKVLPEGTKFT
ncbi:MAG: peptidase associated/transthyretin-like domain-containing protein [Planctomycetota bacterium]|jgi:hypothetical protein